MKNNDFLVVKLNQKNEFRTTASFEINGMKFSAVDVKIDTQGETVLVASQQETKSFIAALSELVDVRKV